MESLLRKQLQRTNIQESRKKYHETAVDFSLIELIITLRNKWVFLNPDTANRKTACVYLHNTHLTLGDYLQEETSTMLHSKHNESIVSTKS